MFLTSGLKATQMNKVDISSPDAAADEPEPRQLAEWQTQGMLDALVTRVATRFMDTSARTLRSSLTQALQDMTEFFSVDTSFLRRNDTDRELSILVAEWPPRPIVPDPDPLGEVPFDADPVFGLCRHLNEPYVSRPTESDHNYQERVKVGSGVDGVSMAAVPLMRHADTAGVLGFINFGDRQWATPEVNALQAIASLIVQLQARVDAEEQLQFHAYHDDLTGMSNRRALIKELDRRLALTTRPTALLFLDLDRFKSMNGLLGHSAGDELLRAVACRLQNLVRKDDFAARLAGDEFVLVLDDLADQSEVAEVATRLLDVLRQPIAIGENEIIRTGSLGIAVSQPGTRTSDELLRNADAAMRRAKAAGGNRSVLFDEALRLAEDEKASTEICLRRAIDAGELILHYQPEIDLRTGELTAVEALVRWNRPDRGMQVAGQFINVAEETGLIVDLDRWVIEEACRQMAEWRRAQIGKEFTIRVNLSPAQLSTSNILELVSSCLIVNELPGRLVCFEITEHALMHNTQQAIEALHSLRLLGITLAMDDFGTGFSSMTQLKTLPLDVLKIDQSFVAGLGTDGGDRAIVDASMRLGRSFGLDIVAEGIETPEALDQLVRLGCDRGQGFLIMRPSPADDLRELIERGRLDLDALRQVRGSRDGTRPSVPQHPRRSSSPGTRRMRSR